MGSVSPADVLALAARLAFVVVLYLFVVAVLLSLRRTIRATGVSNEAPRAAGSLVLTEASAADGPPGRAIPLDRSLVIGRRPDCDVVLRDDSVSGHHARVGWDGNGWQVEDLGSRNGTFVNGKLVKRAAALRSGDAVRVGNASWRVELPA
jgi:pSer/pThr/pTyr-binding forkhead associated (FHA) protein